MLVNLKKIIVYIIVIGSIDATQRDKYFCYTTGVPRGKRSCSSALWEDASETTPECYMSLPGNENETASAIECNALSFDTDQKSENAYLGRVKLRAFYEEGPTGTDSGINVTFSDIKWESMSIRFKENGKNIKNLCREFTLSPKPVSPEKELFYDCIWDYLEDKEYEFEFKASKSSMTSIGRYYYTVPRYKYIRPTNAWLNESELFMYLDLTHQPLIKLHLQTARERFNIGSENYVVKVHSNTSGYVTETKMIPESVEDDQITYHFQTYSRKGSYYFTAEIVHANCTMESGCYVSKSPSIVIRGNPYRDVVLIAIAGCGAAVLAILSFLYFLCRMRINSLKAPRPTVLLVYSPTTAKHTLAIVEFARFLGKFCHVEALVDELGIPLTRSKDPFTWCTDAFSKANAIMVVASPHVACSHYERIYRNIDALCLRLLREKMADKKLEIKYLTVLLPYCVTNETGLPDEAKHLRRFYLPSDLANMLTYIHTGSTTYHKKFCISDLIQAGLSEITSKESDFVKAVKEAENEVRIGVERCNLCSSAPTDHEAGPLLTSRFISIDLPREPADDDKLLWPSINNSPQSDQMFPGPIENLNLLGSEGVTQVDNSTAGRAVGCGFDLNALHLG